MKLSNFTLNCTKKKIVLGNESIQLGAVQKLRSGRGRYLLFSKVKNCSRLSTTRYIWFLDLNNIRIWQLKQVHMLFQNHIKCPRMSTKGEDLLFWAKWWHVVFGQSLNIEEIKLDTRCVHKCKISNPNIGPTRLCHVIIVIQFHFT